MSTTTIEHAIASRERSQYYGKTRQEYDDKTARVLWRLRRLDSPYATHAVHRIKSLPSVRLCWEMRPRLDDTAFHM